MKTEIHSQVQRRTALSWLNLRGCSLALVIAGLGCAATRASAQATNAPATNEFAGFQIIAERNIFNPNRSARGVSLREPRQREPRVDSFSLVGFQHYNKGLFAFFAGSSSDYQKAVTVEDTIAGFKVATIRRDGVILERDGNQIELPMGGQVRREDRGEWRVVAPAATASRQESEAAAATSSEPPDVGSSEANEVLRRMMERRAKEEN